MTVFGDDRRSLFGIGRPAVDRHGVAEAELFGLIDPLDLDRRELDEVGVEATVEAHLVHPRAQIGGPPGPRGRFGTAAEMVVELGDQPERLDVAGIVAVHDAPEGVVGDLELQPLVPAGGISEVPGVDGVGPLHEVEI